PPPSPPPFPYTTLFRSEVTVEIRKAGATERGLVIFEGLDHRAHGAVEHQDALAGSREQGGSLLGNKDGHRIRRLSVRQPGECPADRKSTRLNSSHSQIS